MDRRIDVEFQNVTCKFGDVLAVNDVSLQIKSGEFFAMLGPSGSGKTTCLRLVAGFEQPTKGHVLIHGTNATGIPPYERDVNTVFQDYALFPHMTVGENVGYSLMLKNVAKPEIRSRVEEMLETVRLPDLYERKPSQLSGGQRQRVALARALINNPSVLLLDEPLGALDLKLREEMQVELKQLQRKVGITFFFVTHDQEEALSMSDRVAIFNNGKIEQVGSPAEVYEKPATEFVANFVGVSNIIKGEEAKTISGSSESFMIRPEKIILCEEKDSLPAEDYFCTKARLVDSVYSGAISRYVLELKHGTRINIIRQNNEPGSRFRELKSGDDIKIGWKKSEIHRV